MATQSNRAMVSETSICNQALSWVGASPITSMEDPGEEASWCRENYPFLRDAVLEERMWTFATFRDKSVTADLDEWGKMYQHSAPLDALGIFRVYRDVSNSDPSSWLESHGWRKEGRFILANDATVYIWGTKRITDTGYFSNMFSQCLAERLAADMAMPLTGNEKKARYHWQLYQAKLADAAARDGQQGTNEMPQSRSLIEARWRG